MTTAAGKIPETVRTRERCPHCNAAMELVSPRNGEAYRRCTSCGRDDREAKPTPVARVSLNGAGRKCTVDGCPGVLDAGGGCPCCAKRERFVIEHTPARACDICGGRLPPGGRALKFCKACKKIAAKIPASQRKVGKS